MTNFLKSLHLSFSTFRGYLPSMTRNSDDYNLRQEFFLYVDLANTRQAVQIISDTIGSFNYVLKGEEKPLKIMADSLNAEKVKLQVTFWFTAQTFKGSVSSSKSDIMLAVFDKLETARIRFLG